MLFFFIIGICSHVLTVAIQAKLRFLLGFGFIVSLRFYFVHAHIEILPGLVSDGSSKFVRLFENTSSKKFELPYLLVLLSFTLHFFCIPCSSTRANLSSEMVCKSTYMYDRVNNYTAKYFTDHGWTN